ncbi:MAG: phosphatidylserine/phosphatidylglycerophosphate/cardiolipin synthase family protein [Bacteriovoracaceae bacterium]|nr:phosphatidylserine/phosphatidylglycerophosphate/cardiolipin synthase family protein [Bacteriovoracaceae bacterium]
MKATKNLAILLLLLIFSNVARSEVSVLFHPYDDTFSAIVSRLKTARERIDLALYNLEATDQSSIIAFIKTDEIQSRIKSEELSIRLIFEGYASEEDNLAKMLLLEKIGIDARALSSSKKMHHKFAVIDGHRFDGSVISGSANWSLGSLKNYNENILFFDQEGDMSQQFQEEFDFLWAISKEIGQGRKILPYTFEKTSPSIGKVYFNRHNFIERNGKLQKKRGDIGYRLTKEIVRSIDNAKEKIEVATTRLKLRPIYNALVRAANRGVKVQILVTMGEYDRASKRARMSVKTCSDEFDRKCSSGLNYAALLAKKDYEGSENIDVRLKFFNLKTEAYLTKQMHSKYLIIDDERLLTGSFNWSYSSEFNHIENVIELEKNESLQVLEDFNRDFKNLWDQGRQNLTKLHQKISNAKKEGKKMDCSFSPMSLEYIEVDSLLRRGTRFCQ